MLPQATLVEVAEVEMPVKLGGSLVDGVNDYGPSAEVSSTTNATAESIDEKMTAEMLALFATVDCETSQQHDKHRVGHPSPQPRRRPAVSDGAHGQGVVAHRPRHLRRPVLAP